MRSAQKTNVYEYVVVGSGLAGLTVATALSKSGAQVLLLEAGDQYGGLNRPVPTKVGLSENGLRFLPDVELSHHALTYMSALLGEEIRFETVEREPHTYDSTGLHPFLGFGDEPPEFYDELAYFLNPHEIVLEKPVHTWLQKLSENFTGELSVRSYVTKFHYEEGKIHSMTINGQKTIQALNVIYAGPLKSLPLLLPEAALSAKVRQKLAKSKFWTALGLDLVHAKPTAEFLGIHLLNGTTQDDIGPCVGRFLAPQELNGEQVQFSQWLSFIDDEDAEDTEKIGLALKKIKRQIKRAYPESLESPISERILVVPSFAGSGDLKLTGHQTLPQANNFWVASGGVHPRKNLLGTLEQSQLVTSALGVNPIGTVLDNDSSIEEDSGEAESETL